MREQPNNTPVNHLPMALAGDPALPAEKDSVQTRSAWQDLDDSVRQIQLQQFSYWWRENRPGYRAGATVGQMWRQYPFGALLLDETWAWWSVAQVAADGRNCAKDAGHSNGVVVASTSVSLAVLDWTDGTRSESMIFIVAKYAGVAAAAPRVALTHEKFMQDTGFDREDKLLGCCFCGRNLTLAAPAALAARAPVDTKKINAPQLDVTMGMLHEAIQHQGVPSQTPRQAVRAPNGYSHQTRAMQHGHPASSGLTHSNVLSGHQRWSSTNV